MATLNHYRVYCNTDSKHEYVWAETEPTTCPTDPVGHTIDTAQTTIVERKDDATVSPTLANIDGEARWYGNGDAVWTCTKTTTTSHYLLMSATKDHLLVEGTFIADGNAEWGDYAEFFVEDKDGVSYPAGTVLGQFCFKIGVVPNERRLFRSGEATTIPAGMYLRVDYTSTGTVNNVKALADFMGFEQA